MGVAGGVKGDGAHRTCAGRVGRIVILENLNVGAKIELHSDEVGVGMASDDGRWAEIFGYAVLPRELVEASKGVCQHVSDHDLWDALERQTGASKDADMSECGFYETIKLVRYEKYSSYCVSKKLISKRE